MTHCPVGLQYNLDSIIAQQSETNNQMSSRTCILGSTFIATLLALMTATDLVRADGVNDIEIDSLADRFAGSLRSVNEKLGANGPNGPVEAEEIGQKMRELYSHLETTLTNARQRAANARSALISSKIDALRLA